MGMGAGTDLIAQIQPAARVSIVGRIIVSPQAATGRHAGDPIQPGGGRGAIWHPTLL
jgi:hypothetical protein